MTADYDIIFAGGGTCACVAASRLAAAAPNLRILLIEAGKHTKGLPEVVQPGRFPIHLAPSSSTLTFHVGDTSEHIGGRSIVVPIAHCVGGGSSINVSMYTRAAASDYNEWETVHGNSGWGFTDLLPLAERLETYQIDPNASLHGADGPIKVSYGSMKTNLGEQFLDMTPLYDKSRSCTGDVNDFSTVNAFGRWPKYIDQARGMRSDVVHNYIYNNDAVNKNIHILEKARVKRVIFEGTRAVGVEWVAELPPDIDSLGRRGQQVNVVRCSKMVVVSAGALGTPTILERSGIGSSDLLRKFDIEVLVDLPGVGENYMDHNGAFFPVIAADDLDSLDDMFQPDAKPSLAELFQKWEQDGSTMLGHNGIDAGIKFRPTLEELKAIGPDFTTRWENYFANAPDKPVLWMGPISAAFYVAREPGSTTKYFTMKYFVEYPISVGHAHITSSEDPHAPLDFHPAFLESPADLALLRFAYKKAREWSRRIRLFRGEHAAGHPFFPPNSSARIVASKEGPFAIDEPDLVYSAEDDAAIDEFTRRIVTTTWHSLGTCAMKPRDKKGVVDSALNVYGVQGLKVADGSICPSNVSANTSNTVMIIGEKAAMIIASELGIEM
ncbi:hypothetical protein BDV98DRAFT_563991 [Pterulicium gracile]|uniref:Glucose-methanol-choline oxidoreductase N-terminal domain-containing protein n=1 Tax=Pterulicium gracile TaxID=1884261 RepID=A0A5C3QR58_9AGAR|nr:hypothetical protein BDV98DRAFT_563991 [Pterula gracilis]